ncbi:unnamed protein product, partial [Mesorhabditis spiculigera]
MTRIATVFEPEYPKGSLTCGIALCIASCLPESRPDTSDPSPSSPHPSLSFLAAQLFAHIALAFALGIPVPYMLALNKPYFMNEILSKAPAVLYVTAAATAGCIQFWSGLHRNLTTVFPAHSIFVFSNALIGVIIASSFVFAVLAAIEIDREHNTMEFMINYEVEAEMPEGSHQQTAKDRLYRLLLHLLTDAVYVTIVLVPSFGESTWNRISYDLVRIYGLALWPMFAAAWHTPLLAKALRTRIVLVLTACSGPERDQNTPGSRRTWGSKTENRMRLTV